LSAAFDLAPNTAMRGVCNVARNFQMPGHGIENFGRKSVQIALAGIYDLRIHYDEVLMPVLRQLGAFERTELSGEGEAAREELSQFMAGLDSAATRFTERREAHRARAASRA
jgi:acyl-[acyl-carrier-protein] desaturase